MKLITEPYPIQVARWPTAGRQIVEACAGKLLDAAPVDPDHDPSGAPTARRAIQLDLRGEFLARYAREWILEIEDITPFVREQHAIAQAGEYSRLVTPREWLYPVEPSIARKLELDDDCSVD